MEFFLRGGPEHARYLKIPDETRIVAGLAAITNPPKKECLFHGVTPFILYCYHQHLSGDFWTVLRTSNRNEVLLAPNLSFR